MWSLETDRTNRLAAEAIYCAAEAGKFWEMQEWLYFNVDRWSSADDVVTALSEMAAPEVGVDGAGLAVCLREERYRSRLEAFADDADRRGVTGTPSFLIGGRTISGAYPFEAFQQAIEEALQK